ncbi:WD repeat-containing protein 63 [Chelonia mydas]|uniref:WD repeat-containing protein 63 n=1 Tax=Chelonia mydas TaxID=8469 RepID=M7ARW4_CHEMY|nr:WD repeat-containing protein 63 [Chelonia mydas]
MLESPKSSKTSELSPKGSVKKLKSKEQTKAKGSAKGKRKQLGIIAVSVTERLSYEERIAQSGKLLLRKSPILFWSFSDPIHPQVVLWDISEYEEKLQNAKTGAGGSKNTAVNMANLSKSDTSGDYSPTKISLVEEHFHYKMQDKMQYQVKPEIFGDENPYKQLKVPSAKALQILENIPTNFFVGTEDGEVIYSDWKMERESDSGRLISQKPANKYTIHDGIVHTIQRSPFFKDIILSVGGWNFAIWKEGVTRVAGGQKSREQMEEQMNINYVDFLDEEKKILTGLGLLKATDRFA